VSIEWEGIFVGIFVCLPTACVAFASIAAGLARLGVFRFESIARCPSLEFSCTAVIARAAVATRLHDVFGIFNEIPSHRFLARFESVLLLVWIDRARITGGGTAGLFKRAVSLF
jgi:hypothetical protein